MTVTPVDHLLDIARKYIGQHEQPAHSNTGAFVIGCQRHTWLPGTGWPWCVAFAQRVFAEAGHPLPYRTAGAYDLLRWARRTGWAVPIPRPGAIAVWNIGTGHASIVESYDLKTKIVTTIDGNVGDQVQRCRRSVTLAAGFVWNPALAGKPAAPAAKPPHRMKVGSIGGTTKTFLKVPWKRDPLDGWVAVS